MTPPAPARPARRRRVLPHELPAEIKVVAVPFWILVSTRRRYWAARAARLRPDADSWVRPTE